MKRCGCTPRGRRRAGFPIAGGPRRGTRRLPPRMARHFDFREIARGGSRRKADVAPRFGLEAALAANRPGRSQAPAEVRRRILRISTPPDLSSVNCQMQHVELGRAIQSS